MTKKLTPMQSIKQYCSFECCANDLIQWKECGCIDCPLHCYRFGTRPKTSSKASSDKKEVDLSMSFEENGEGKC